MAKKDINVITSLCGKGLEQEYLLLKKLLNSHDVYTVGIHYTNYSNATLVRADANIFLEVVHPLALSLSRENWLVPNSEWWDPKNDRFLPQFTKVLCKTMDCHRIWSEKVGANKCVYTGFLSRDLYRPDVTRTWNFLHVAGESEHKNTEAVIDSWKTNILPHAWRPPLTVVTRQKRFQDMCEGVENITCIVKASEDELAQLMNSHLFHLIPSAYEGFGHILHEGLGCGALVITTDAPPMNSFNGVVQDWLVPVFERSKRSLAQMCSVAPPGILESLRKAGTVVSKDGLLDQLSKQARTAFLADNAVFAERFLGLLGVS